MTGRAGKATHGATSAREAGEPHMVQIKMKYVHEDVDRYGNVRIYFRRRPGARKIRLEGTPGSATFMAAYQAALAGYAEATATPNRAPKPQPQTFRWLCAQWLASPAYARLERITRRTRRQILEACCNEPTAPDAATLFGEMPIDRFTSKAVRVLRDRKAGLPSAANNRMKAISGVFSWALDEEIGGVLTNPARDVRRERTTGEGFHSWTLEEIKQYEARHPIGTRARLALALLLYLGQRRSDVVQIGRQHLQNGWIRFVQQKNRSRSAVRLELPVIPALQWIIDATPTGGLAFLQTEFGKPFTANGFGNKMRDWCNQAGLPHCSAHGLRKAAAAWLADAGATTHEIMAITGHRTIGEVERYTKAANQKRLARSAMDKATAGQAA